MPKRKNLQNNIFVLKEKIQETDDVMTLKLLPKKRKVFSFQPGQFVMVYFLDNRCGSHGKPYSISNCLGEKFLNITVKKLGEFSGTLHNLKIGDKLKIIGPQGYFYPEDKMKNIVFLAGGIGITPFYSMINTFLKKKTTGKKLFLFYSNKTKSETVFLKELDELAKNWLNLKVVYIFTREKKKSKRLDIKILKKHLKTLNKKYYFICGPIEFVNDLWKELKKDGIKEDYIRVESFY